MLKFLRQHKEKEEFVLGKKYYGQIKLKLICLFIIIEIMCGRKVAKSTHQSMIISG